MTTELTTSTSNPFLAYSTAVNRRVIIGDLLRFNKGEWVAGSNEEEIENGTQFVALMDELMVGWTKWEGGKPVEHQLGKLVEGYRPFKRSELGDADEGLWETDMTGKRRDPWQLVNHLILKEVDSDRLYTFAPSSRGGLNAIGQLCEAYGKAIRAKPDSFPIIEVGVSAYKHDSYGKVKIPVLKVVGWTPKAEAMAALDASTDEATDDLEATPF